MHRNYRLYRIVEKTIGRSAAWRIGRWLYAGARRELANDPHINGEYALQSWIITACLQVGDSDPLFLDVGANVGNWSLSLVRKLSAASLRARIIAFEPAPEQSSALVKALDRVSDNVDLSCRIEALSDVGGEGRLQVTGAATGTSSLVANNGGTGQGYVTVRLSTVDAVMEREALKHVTLLKIDTEGNDFKVIRGAKKAMAQGAIDVIQFEYNWRWLNFGYSMFDVFRAIDGFNYTLGRLSGDGIELYENWHPELDRFMETNFILISSRLKKYLPAFHYRFDPSNVATRSS